MKGGERRVTWITNCIINTGSRPYVRHICVWPDLQQLRPCIRGPSMMYPDRINPESPPMVDCVGLQCTIKTGPLWPNHFFGAVNLCDKRLSYTSVNRGEGAGVLCYAAVYRGTKMLPVHVLTSVYSVKPQPLLYTNTPLKAFFSSCIFVVSLSRAGRKRA